MLQRKILGLNIRGSRVAFSTPFSQVKSNQIFLLRQGQSEVAFYQQRKYANRRGPSAEGTEQRTTESINFEEREANWEALYQETKLPSSKPGFKLPAQPYRLVASVILERPVIVAPPLESWETDYMKMHEELDAAQAKLQEEASTLRAEMEMKLRAKKQKKKDEKGKPAEVKQAPKKPKQEEVEEEEEEEEEEKKVYSLITPDDEANNRKSLYRKLNNRLYLIVKKNRQEHPWQFPQGEYEERDGDSLKRTVERETREELGNDLDAFFLGNWPVAHHTYKMGPEAQKVFKKDATKVFFYKAQYVNGKIMLNPKELVDHLWVTKEELKEYISPDLYESVKDTLLD